MKKFFAIAFAIIFIAAALIYLHKNMYTHHKNAVIVQVESGHATSGSYLNEFKAFLPPTQAKTPPPVTGYL